MNGAIGDVIPFLMDDLVDKSAIGFTAEDEEKEGGNEEEVRLLGDKVRVMDLKADMEAEELAS